MYDVAIGSLTGVTEHARLSFPPQTQDAIDKTVGLYAAQAHEHRLGPGAAEKFGIAEVVPMITTVFDLIGNVCNGQIGSMQTAQAMKSPTPLQNSMHWRTCEKAARQEIIDSRLKGKRRGSGYSGSQWRRMKKDLKELRYDAARRVFSANNEASQNASLQELASMIDERRAS